MINDCDVSYIQSIVRLAATQSKKTLVYWAIDYSRKIMLPIWTKYYPNDLRPQEALNAAYDWIYGKIKLPEAKIAIRKCHAAAREAASNPCAMAAARAVGQSASGIHSPRHCIGLALYGALAVSYDKLGTNAAWEQLEQYAAIECGHMLEALEAVAVENEEYPAKINWKL